jgi:hypothetical protein
MTTVVNEQPPIYVRVFALNQSTVLPKYGSTKGKSAQKWDSTKFCSIILLYICCQQTNKVTYIRLFDLNPSQLKLVWVCSWAEIHIFFSKFLTNNQANFFYAFFRNFSLCLAFWLSRIVLTTPEQFINFTSHQEYPAKNLISECLTQIIKSS